MIRFYRWIARLFRMDGETWRRHANPWSVWTRMVILPFLAFSIWSRIWIYWWSLFPIGLILIWTWLNPRVFPEPDSLDNWASKAVMGEQLWLNRDRNPLPANHRIFPNFLTVVSGTGFLLLAWGLYQLLLWPTILGLIVSMLGKLWFADRMVWLYEEMSD